MLRNELGVRVQELTERRQPFVLATVVRVRRPTSVRPGDSAVVLGDGTMEGFVGGVCATTSVRLYSLRAIESGEPMLLCLEPGEEGEDAEPALDGAVTERNPCHSGGSMEIFLEPHLPAPRLVIVGDSPIAHALERVGQAAGYYCHVAPAGASDVVDGAAAVVVAAHGSGEEAVLAAALRARVPYVALVASSSRGELVRAELEVDEQLRTHLHTPAGLAIGAETPGEIAISILAEVVAQSRPAPSRQQATPTSLSTASPAVSEANDPVCGMRVAVTDTTPQLLVGETSVYFCCEGCCDKYAREHAEAVAAR